LVGQQLQAHGGQASPGAQAGQAQAHPPPPGSIPASTGEPGCIRAHDPVAQGAVTHSMLSEVQPQASAVSAAQEVTSVCAKQGSGAGVAPQPHGAQEVPAGQAGQPQTEPGAEPLPVPVPAPAVGAVIVVVVPLLQEQLQAAPAQSAPAGHSGQLQVQVPEPPPVPVAPPVPVPQPPPPAPPPVPPVPHAQSHFAQGWPGAQAGQPQVQVPPPPASAGAGSGQSHWTAGHGPLAGQATG
jgi:hypothetical protein